LVQYAWKSEADHASSLEKECRAADAGWPSHLQVRRDDFDLISAAGDEQHPQGPIDRRAHVHSLLEPLSEGMGFRSCAFLRTRRTGCEHRHLASIRGRVRQIEALWQDRTDCQWEIQTVAGT